MGLLPHAPLCPLPPSAMPPPQDPYHYPDPSSIQYEDSSDSSVTRHPHPLEQSWTPPITTSDQVSYAQPHQTLDPVGNSLGAHEVGDVNYPFNYPDPGYPQPGTSPQGLGVETNATYINDNTLPPFVNSFHPYPELGHEFSQNQQIYTPYDSTSTYYALQYPAQHIHASQVPHESFTAGYSYPSSTLLQVSHAEPVYQTNAALAHSIPNSLTLGGADTVRTDAGADQHSHQSFASTSSSNQSSVLTPGRPLPSSPERKRLLSLTAADELSTARRVVPRHDRASSVHSRTSLSPRRSRSNSVVLGRGPRIPQERYTTSSTSSHNTPDQIPVITFNLENPNQIGIPIIDILNKTGAYNRIRDRAETFDMEKKTFTLRVQWPGYGLWSKTIAAKDWKKTRSPISRVKLAEAVATATRDLFERYRDQPCDSVEMWSVGPNGIQLDQICLVALHHVSRGSWQPELCLLGPRG